MKEVTCEDFTVQRIYPNHRKLHKIGPSFGLPMNKNDTEMQQLTMNRMIHLTKIIYIFYLILEKNLIVHRQ